MEEDLIELQGIFEKGYGLIPKLVMQDKDIPIHAKGLYAYLCSFSGKGKDVFPSRDKICYDLDISKNVLTKYLNILKTKGYITITQNKDDRNRFCNNIYKINILLPCPTFPCTEISVSAEMTPNNNNINNNNNNKKEIIIKESIKEAIDYLNQKTNSSFKSSSKSTIKLIRARLSEGYTLIEIKQVIDFKCSQWLNDSKMRQYLQPSTLFGNKFEGYLQASQNSAGIELKSEEIEFGMYKF